MNSIIPLLLTSLAGKITSGGSNSLLTYLNFVKLTPEPFIK